MARKCLICRNSPAISDLPLDLQLEKRKYKLSFKVLSSLDDKEWDTQVNSQLQDGYCCALCFKASEQLWTFMQDLIIIKNQISDITNKIRNARKSGIPVKLNDYEASDSDDIQRPTCSVMNFAKNFTQNSPSTTATPRILQKRPNVQTAPVITQTNSFSSPGPAISVINFRSKITRNSATTTATPRILQKRPIAVQTAPVSENVATATKLQSNLKSLRKIAPKPNPSLQASTEITHTIIILPQPQAATTRTDTKPKSNEIGKSSTENFSKKCKKEMDERSSESDWESSDEFERSDISSGDESQFPKISISNVKTLNDPEKLRVTRSSSKADSSVKNPIPVSVVTQFQRNENKRKHDAEEIANKKQNVTANVNANSTANAKDSSSSSLSNPVAETSKRKQKFQPTLASSRAKPKITKTITVGGKHIAPPRLKSRVMKCEICNEKILLNRLSAMADHIKQFHKPVPKKFSAFSCPYCPLHCDSEADGQIHIQLEHTADVNNGPPITNSCNII